MRKDASQIVPPRSSDPMKEGPLCQIRREARARGAVATLVSERLNAVDLNRPNRDARLFKTSAADTLLHGSRGWRPERDRGSRAALCLTRDARLAVQAEPGPPPSHPGAEAQGHELI